ncbi:MAG TPA: amidohydrolase [Clostridium sp.]|nr:amidohydrolase [Clostridium sp.]
MKEELFNEIDSLNVNLYRMADYIFDNPELGNKEFKAARTLTSCLEQNGFSVELGIAELDTAFRATYKNGNDGPSIGLLCEYDALENLGHACGHHMQGPAILGAAIAIKNILKEMPYTLVIYGTPAEETTHGKLRMIEHGFFNDIDIALMMHGSPTTTTDVKSLAMSSFTVTFHGIKSHAALMPEEGRSAFDALLLAFNGVEFLREHVRDDVRMHYTVLETPGPTNVVPARAVGKFSLRSYSRSNLDEVVKRFKKIIEGASLMADVSYEIKEGDRIANKIPVIKLNDLLMKNAELAEAPRLSPPREKTGSTDFSNVMYMVPGSCIRMAFVPVGVSSHTDEFAAAGKTESAYKCISYAAKTLAGVAYDVISDKKVLEGIKSEFKINKEIYM